MKVACNNYVAVFGNGLIPLSHNRELIFYHGGGK